jgi:glycosyltransferase involved in cell wall biosynthesis
MPKKIMIIMMLSSLDGSRSLGGLDTACQSHLRGLIEYGGEHKYLILGFNPANDTPASGTETRVAANISVLWYDYSRRARRLGVPNVLANEWLVKKLVEKHAPEVVHSHLPCWHIRKYCGERKILTLHQFGDIGRSRVNLLNDLLHKRLIEPYSCRMSDIITSVSRDIYQIFQIKCNNKVRYIPNPVPSCGVGEPRAAPTERPIRLLLVGTISRGKRVLDALQTVRLLKSEHPDIKLIVAGRAGSDNNYIELLKNFVNAHELNENVEFSGALSRQNLNIEIKRTHVAVFFSEAETFGLAPLECLTAGIPLVTTDVGVFNWHKTDFTQLGVDVIDVGNYGAAAEAISKRIKWNDFSLQVKVRDYIRDKFSINVCARNYIDTYESV